MSWDDQDLARAPGSRRCGHRVGRAAFALVWHCLGVELAAGRSCIVEGNFGCEWAEEQFRELASRYEIAPLQIHCFAAPHILRQRHARRIAVRHPGHVDRARLADADQLFKPERYMLRIAGDLLRVDTTSISDLDCSGIQRAVAEHLNSA